MNNSSAIHFASGETIEHASRAGGRATGSDASETRISVGGSVSDVVTVR
jgi:hypothetical protein